jgi:hypothetical protein
MRTVAATPGGLFDIMEYRTGRLAALFIPLILLAACASGQQRTARLLDQRMQNRLATEIAAGQAVVEKVPEGERVTLLGPSLFPNDTQTLDNRTPDIRANVIEGLLDPRLMRVQVADNSTLPAVQRDARVRNVADYFTANGLGSVLLPGDAAPVTGGPAGLVMTISLACPPHDWFIGYRDGRARPVCD